MSHGIYTARDFQVAEEMAWHKLTRIAKPTIQHFPEIEGVPCYYNGGTELVYGDKRYLVPIAKDDKLPVAPPYCEGTYTLFTPREAWEWVTGLLAGTSFNVQSIGMLWNRSFWFMSTELTELKSLSIGDGRETKFQLNFSGGLDRKVSPQCELSSIVAVCHNTISLSRSTGTVLFNERLTSNFKDRLEAAKSEVEKAVGMAAVFKAAMDSLAAKPCTQDTARTIFAGYITPSVENEAERMADGEFEVSGRTKKAIDELAELHVSGLGNRGESEFDLLNAYTQHLTHGGSDSKVPMGRRFASSEFGNAADSKADFVKVLTTERTERLSNILSRGEKVLAAIK